MSELSPEDLFKMMSQSNYDITEMCNINSDLFAMYLISKFELDIEWNYDGDGNFVDVAKYAEKERNVVTYRGSCQHDDTIQSKKKALFRATFDCVRLLRAG